MTSFKIEEITFTQKLAATLDNAKSTKDNFILVKGDEFLEFYDELLKDLAPKQIMEIGMFDGGSLVYFDKKFKPDQLVGLDIRTSPIRALEMYRAEKMHIFTHYGVSQERDLVENIADRHFGNNIDMVVDDASHHYALTKATFEMLFPKVRQGGMYIIEDWAWAHQPPYQEPDGPWRNERAMSRLLFELTMLAARLPVIDHIIIRRELFAVVKGPGELPGGKVDVSGYLRDGDLGDF